VFRVTLPTHGTPIRIESLPSHLFLIAERQKTNPYPLNAAARA